MGPELVVIAGAVLIVVGSVLLMAREGMTQRRARLEDDLRVHGGHRTQALVEESWRMFRGVTALGAVVLAVGVATFVVGLI